MVKGLPSLTKETSVFIGLLVSLFLIPYIPGPILMLVDTMIVRALLLLGLVSLAYVSPMNAIVGFIVVALLFIERNKHKLKRLRRVMQQSDMSSPAIESIVTPPTAPYQPPFEEPEKDYHSFFPQEDSGDNSFEPVAPSQDEKQPLQTEGSNDGSQKAIDQLFKWVNPDLIQAS